MVFFFFARSPEICCEYDRRQYFRLEALKSVERRSRGPAMELRHDRADRNSWNRRASVKSNRRHGLTVHLYNRRRCRAPLSHALCAARPAVCLPCLYLRVSAYIAVSLPLSMSVSSISLHRVGVSVLCCVSRSPRCCINLSLNVGHMAKRLSTWPPVFFSAILYDSPFR